MMLIYIEREREQSKLNCVVCRKMGLGLFKALFCCNKPHEIEVADSWDSSPDNTPKQHSSKPKPKAAPAQCSNNNKHKTSTTQIELFASAISWPSCIDTSSPRISCWPPTIPMQLSKPLVLDSPFSSRKVSISISSLRILSNLCMFIVLEVNESTS